MTLDQILFRLCDRRVLRDPIGKRTDKRPGAVSQLTPSSDGTIAGRAADGTPIRARIGGKSLASRLKEQYEAEQQMTPQERRAAARARRRERRNKGK